MQTGYSAIPDRIDNLTGIRGFAAVWVVLYHVGKIPQSVYLGPIIGHGDLAVDLFFVLSGFVLPFVYVPKLPSSFNGKWYTGHVKRRLAKIYPLQLITLALSVALFVAAEHFHYQFNAERENTAWSAFCQVLMVHAFGLTQSPSWNFPSWSVSAEWFAYTVLFAPMIFSLRRVKVLYVGLLAGAVWVLTLTFCWLVLDHNILLTTKGILRITPEFLGGYFLYRLLIERRVRYGDLWTVLGVALTMVMSVLSDEWLWLLLPALLLLLTGMFVGGRLTDLIFGNRLVMKIGEASYSLYMTHAFVIIAAIQVIRRTHRAPGVLIDSGVVLVAIAVGYLTFRYIEEPLRQAVLRRFAGKARSPEAMPARLDTQVASTID